MINRVRKVRKSVQTRIGNRVLNRGTTTATTDDTPAPVPEPPAPAVDSYSTGCDVEPYSPMSSMGCDVEPTISSTGCEVYVPPGEPQPMGCDMVEPEPWVPQPQELIPCGMPPPQRLRDGPPPQPLPPPPPPPRPQLGCAPPPRPPMGCAPVAPPGPPPGPPPLGCAPPPRPPMGCAPVAPPGPPPGPMGCAPRMLIPPPVAPTPMKGADRFTHWASSVAQATAEELAASDPDTVPSLFDLCVRTIADEGIVYHHPEAQSVLTPDVVARVDARLHHWPTLHLRGWAAGYPDNEILHYQPGIGSANRCSAARALESHITRQQWLELRTEPYTREDVLTHWPEKALAAIHNDDIYDWALPFSFDLLENAKRVFLLVFTIDETPTLGVPEHVSIAIGRYKSFLQLMERHPDEELIPTLDIATVMYSHRIRPHTYKKDCCNRNLFHPKLLDHPHMLTALDFYGKVLCGDDLRCQELLTRTRDLWMSQFGQDYVTDLSELYGAPDNVPDNVPDVCLPPTPQFSLKIGHIIRDRDWFANLTHLVGPDNIERMAFGDNDYYAFLVKQFERFVYLCTKYDPMHKPRDQRPLITVAYNVDTVFHAAILMGSRYEMDLQRMTGCTIMHEPWPEQFNREDHGERVEDLQNLMATEFGVGLASPYPSTSSS